MSKYTIGEHSYSGAVIHGSLSDIIIGKFCSLANGIILDAGFGHDYNNITTSPLMQIFDSCKHITGHPVTKGPIIIQNDVWIGEEALLLGGITLHNGCVVGARSVVTKSIPAYEIWGGNPARFIKKRFTDTQIEKLLLLKWWDKPDEEIKEIAPLLMSNKLEELLTKYNL